MSSHNFGGTGQGNHEGIARRTQKMEFELAHRARDLDKGLQSFQRERRSSSRFNAFMSIEYGGVRACTVLLMEGNTRGFRALLVVRAKPQQPLNIDSVREVPEHRPRKINDAMKARSRYKHALAQAEIQRAHSHMERSNVNWRAMNRLEVWRTRAEEATRIQNEDNAKQKRQIPI